MTLRWFGGPASGSAVVDPATGEWLPNDAGTVWDAEVGGTQLVDLVDANEATIQGGAVYADSYGYCQMFGTDTDPATEVVWVDFTGGQGQRVRLECRDRAAYRFGADELGQPQGPASLDSNARLAQQVHASHIAGQLTDAQLSAIDASKVLGPPWLRRDEYDPAEQAGVRDLAAELPKPLLWAHRGSALYPENSMEGFRAMVNAGAQGLELDPRLTVDGQLVLMHDSSVDRTTDGSGQLSSLTASRAMSLNIRHDNPTWPSQGIHPPLFEDVLREFGDRVFMSVHIKEAAAVSQVKALLDRYLRLKTNVCVTGSDRQFLAEFLADGRYLVAVQEPYASPVDLASDGVWQVNVNKNDVTQQMVDDFHAVGLRCQIWNLQYADEVDQVYELGLDSAMVDDYEWLSHVAPVLSSDPFAAEAWYPGHRASGAKNNADLSGGFYVDGGFGLANAEGDTGQTASESGVRWGWCSPVNGTPDGGSFTVTFDARWDEANSGLANMYLAWSNRDVGVFGQGGTSGTPTGCAARIRFNGSLTFMTILNGGETVGDSVDSGSMSLGTWETFRVDVSPSVCTITRVSTGASVSADLSGRGGGGYLYWSQGGARATVRNVVIT